MEGQHKKLGTALIVSGPSGVGKSTVFGRLRQLVPDLKFSISCTTRAPRPGESNGVHYHFISKDQFTEHIQNGKFVEYAGVFDHYYGTLKSELLDRVSTGSDVFLDIDVQGAMQIRQAAENDVMLKRCCEFIFIAPDRLATLEQRLRGRGTESENQIQLRLGKAREELSFWSKYDYVIINDDLERAVQDLYHVIKSCGSAVKRLPEDRFND